MVALAAAVYFVTPFTQLWLSANYRWYRSDRLRVVHDVQSGKLTPGHGGVVALPSGRPRVSTGGNEVLVEEHGGKQYVFFYTYRGILDNYSGFLFVPEGGRPSLFGDFGEVDSTQAKPLEPNWYFVAHW